MVSSFIHFIERIYTKWNITTKWNAQGADLKQWNGNVISIKFIWWNLNFEVTTLIINELPSFFISNTFFELSLTVA